MAKKHIMALVTIPIAVILIFAVMMISNEYYKKQCLNSDNPRRWSNGVCEQYANGGWIEIAPINDKIYYNDAAKNKEY